MEPAIEMSTKTAIQIDAIQVGSEEFVLQIKNRESEVVERLVRSYTEALYRGALGLGFDSTAAEELVQNVWVTFFDVAPTFQGRSHVRTFIFGILYNKASEARRDQKRIDDRDPIEDVMNSRFADDGHWVKPPLTPEQFMESAETIGLIQRCINELPLSQRMAFCLKEIDDHGSQDICKILDVTVTNLGVLLYRAKNRLRECIEGKARAKTG
jgi:RNA polymerase sigma-70 factor (ECF subfamily)